MLLIFNAFGAQTEYMERFSDMLKKMRLEMFFNAQTNSFWKGTLVDKQYLFLAHREVSHEIGNAHVR